MVEDKGKVVITVTAEGEARVVEIQKRAEHLDKVATAPDAEIKHTGMGTGGGRSGRCPVVMIDVTLEIARLTDGVKISLSPKDRAATSRSRGDGCSPTWAAWTESVGDRLRLATPAEESRGRPAWRIRAAAHPRARRLRRDARPH